MVEILVIIGGSIIGAFLLSVVLTVILAVILDWQLMISNKKASHSYWLEKLGLRDAAKMIMGK